VEDRVEVYRKTKGAVADASETCYVDVHGRKTGIGLSGLHHHHPVRDQGKAKAEE